MFLQRLYRGTRLLTIIALIFISGCSPRHDAASQKVFNETTFAFGTLVDVTFYGLTDKQADKAFTVVLDDLNYMHNTWHAWHYNALARVNGLLDTGSKFSLAPSILPLITRSQKLSAESEGLFNPAIGKLINMWGFQSDNPDESREPPADADIKAYLAHLPTMQDIHMDGIKMWGTNPNLKLDFGAFAKGYGIDVVIGHLRELGVKNAIINAGGDLRAIGSHGDRPWHIGIRNPRSDGIIASLDTHGDESVFTSGDYERFFTYKNKRYHHIIDPRTGYPADQSTSVTVIHSDAATADAAATALFIAGPKNWYRIAKKMGIKFAMLIDKQGTVYMNPAMAKRIKFEGNKLPKVILSDPL